jgi:uncharacterized oligopeptide transporter (OPT) family protein
MITPVIPPESNIPQFTLQAALLGIFLALLFGAANAYLGLKIGLTVTASIPAAVMGMAIMRGIFKRGTVLEINMVQTIASSGESLAAGVVFTMPALIFLGLQLTWWKVFALSLAGGLLGILLMIPLRRNLMVEEHGKLPFPEGTACAEVILAGEEGGSRAKNVFLARRRLGEGAKENGTLFGSGLIAGDALIGVMLALLAVIPIGADVDGKRRFLNQLILLRSAGDGVVEDILALLPFLLLIVFFWVMIRRGERTGSAG